MPACRPSIRLRQAREWVCAIGAMRCAASRSCKRGVACAHAVVAGQAQAGKGAEDEPHDSHRKYWTTMVAQ